MHVLLFVFDLLLQGDVTLHLDKAQEAIEANFLKHPNFDGFLVIIDKGTAPLVLNLFLFRVFLDCAIQLILLLSRLSCYNVLLIRRVTFLHLELSLMPWILGGLCTLKK